MKRSYQKWTEQEKERLVSLVQEQRKSEKQISWIKISTEIPGKSPRQCYDQWLQYMKQNKESKWDEQKCELLVSMVGQYGQNWEQIQKAPQFQQEQPKRLKHKYNQIMNQKQGRISNVESSTSNWSSFSNYNEESSVSAFSTYSAVPSQRSISLSPKTTKTQPYSGSKLQVSHEVNDASEKVNTMIVSNPTPPQDEQILTIQEFNPSESAPARDKSNSEVFSDFFEFDANF